MRYTIVYASILMLLLSGCGSDDSLKIDPDFQEAFNVYQTFAPDKGNLDQLESIKWADAEDSEEPAHGKCQSRYKQVAGKKLQGSERRWIEITRGPVEGAYNLNALVIHELAHCLHNIGHSSDPEAIMHETVLPDEAYWKEHLTERLYEMFHGKVYEP